MTASLTNDQIMEFKSAFEGFAKGKEEEIHVSELGNVLASLGEVPEESELAAMVKEVDSDGSGSIDFLEFLTMMARKMKDKDSDQEIKACFKLFNKDGRGYVTREQLRMILTNLGEPLSVEEVDDIINEADMDSDNQITYDEFHNFFSLDGPFTEAKRRASQPDHMHIE
eukprot:g4005.t1